MSRIIACVQRANRTQGIARSYNIIKGAHLGYSPVVILTLTVSDGLR